MSTLNFPPFPLISSPLLPNEPLGSEIPIHLTGKRWAHVNSPQVLEMIPPALSLACEKKKKRCFCFQLSTTLLDCHALCMLIRVKQFSFPAIRHSHSRTLLLFFFFFCDKIRNIILFDLIEYTHKLRRKALGAQLINFTAFSDFNLISFTVIRSPLANPAPSPSPTENNSPSRAHV